MAHQWSSWGNFPQTRTAKSTVSWPTDLEQLRSSSSKFLPWGLGRSYGDSCLLNDQSGSLLDLNKMNRFISFDETKGILHAQAGLSFDELIKFSIPRGWFPPVTPGTKYITLGGAVANDIHGKNHHQDGSFGHHLLQIKLWRSDVDEPLWCSHQLNADMFYATLGGLGLTGVITEVVLQLKPMKNSYLDVEIIPFAGLDDYFSLAQESKDFNYTVAWVDTLAEGDGLGRGLYIRGNNNSTLEPNHKLHKQNLSVPFYLPNFSLNTYSVKAFNEVYFRQTFGKAKSFIQHYDPFFYPLDKITHWNRIYGKRGFLQHQCVLPPLVAKEAMREILSLIAQSGQSSFLSVLKDFGSLPSMGMLSFPREGTTLAMDIPMRGQSTLDLLNSLDQIVVQSGGALYPAKDARMSPSTFRASFPLFEEFLEYKDPRIQSDFFKRMSKQGQN